MEKVIVEDAPVAPRFKIEVTKNTKGYNYVVSVRNDDLKHLKEEIEDLESWAKEKYGN